MFLNLKKYALLFESYIKKKRITKSARNLRKEGFINGKLVNIRFINYKILGGALSHGTVAKLKYYNFNNIEYILFIFYIIYKYILYVNA